MQQEERAAAAELAKAKREEDALVAKHCAKPIAPETQACAERQRATITCPTRQQLITAVAETFDMHDSIAEEWLIATFMQAHPVPKGAARVNTLRG